VDTLQVLRTDVLSSVPVCERHVTEVLSLTGDLFLRQGLLGIHRFDGGIVLSLQGFASSDVTVYYYLGSTVHEDANPPRSSFLPLVSDGFAPTVHRHGKKRCLVGMFHLPAVPQQEPQ